MKPYTTGGHSAYQDLVLTQLRKYYPDAADSLPSSAWEIMERFWNLDLSPLNSIMQDCYSVFGPAPRQPSDMLRSFLLSVESSSHPSLSGLLNSGTIIFMPSSAASRSGIRQALALSTISSIACGSLISRTSVTRSILRRNLPKNLIKREKRLHRQTKSGLKIFWHSFRQPRPMKQIPVHCSLRSSPNCFCTPPPGRAWLI